MVYSFTYQHEYAYYARRSTVAQVRTILYDSIEKDTIGGIQKSGVSNQKKER
jgi:hypothetical protein